MDDDSKLILDERVKYFNSLLIANRKAYLADKDALFKNLRKAEDEI